MTQITIGYIGNIRCAINFDFECSQKNYIALYNSSDRELVHLREELFYMHIPNAIEYSNHVRINFSTFDELDQYFTILKELQHIPNYELVKYQTNFEWTKDGKSKYENLKLLEKLQK